jgi:hypothetical protein
MRTQAQRHSPDIDAWGTSLVEKVVTRLERRIQDFESNPAPGVSAPSIEQQQRKFAFLKRLIDVHYAYKPDLGQRHRYSELHRIIKGLIVEFITQSERDIQPVNIEHNRNPEAKRYWDELAPDALARAKLPGMFHVAASYNHLRQSTQTKGVNSAARFHVVGELVRVSIDVFQEEHPKLRLEHSTRASIYNDHFAAIALALSMRKG